MSKSLKFWRFVHIWSGRIIVLFFFMWFFSGMVLIYHPYPKLTDKEIYARMPLCGDSVADVTTADDVARQWSSYPIFRRDTLMQTEQWVILPKYENELPIYKFYFDDPQKTELFVSGKDLKPIQLTTRKTRFWAYLGAIPHKFYIPSLRRNTEVWKKTVTWGGIFCFIAALSGMIEGIGILRRRYKKTGKIGNPYKKWPMRLHFGFGIVVGVFLVTWGISGIFAMNKVPQWVAPTKDELEVSQISFWKGKSMPDSSYILGAKDLLKVFPNLKEVEYVHFGTFPAVKAIIGDSAYYFMADNKIPVKMEIPEDAIRAQLAKICGDSLTYTLQKRDDYTQYYMPRLRGQANLPVYEAKIADSVGSTIYIDPSDGYLRYITDHKRWRKWLFEGFHYWNINGFYTCTPLWTIFIWCVCISCMLVCLTGVVVTVKKIFRRSASKKREFRS